MSVNAKEVARLDEIFNFYRKSGFVHMRLNLRRATNSKFVFVKTARACQ